MKRITLILIAILTVTGCRASREEIAADEKVLETYAALNRERTAMVTSAMESCAVDAAMFAACLSDLCRVDTIREARGCQQGIIEAAGKVALELPKQRANAWDTLAKETGQTIRAVIPYAAAYAQTRNVVRAMSRVSTSAIDGATAMGRPNIDQSITTITRDSGNTTSGDTLTAGRDLTGRDRGGDIDLGPGAQVGDRGDNNTGNSGRINAPGDNCTGNQCQPANILNPVDNSPQPGDPAPVPGDADGICFFFSLIQDPDCT